MEQTLLAAMLAGIILSIPLAENATPRFTVHNGPVTAPGTARRARVEPCWEVAGVSKAGVAAAAKHCPTGAAGSEAVVREFVRLDAAEAAADPADS